MLNRKSIILILFILVSFIIKAQNISVPELKLKGRDSIIVYANEKLKESKIFFDLPVDSLKIRVMANNKEIKVLYNMGFYWNENAQQFKNYDIIVTMNENNYYISPYKYDSTDYKLNPGQKKVIQFVMNDMECPFEEDERVTIKEGKGFYELIFSRGIESGAECYHIDKKTGERSMVWHESPYPGKNNFIIDGEDKFIEIK